jgi:hypothetical protein
MPTPKPAAKPSPAASSAPKAKAKAATSAKTPKRGPGTKVATAAPLAAPPAAPESPKVKHKLVRDSFTIPKNEYAALADLKQRAARLGHPAKKSEILRAGAAALGAMPDHALLAALRAIPSLKTGRPKDTPSAVRGGSTRKP